MKLSPYMARLPMDPPDISKWETKIIVPDDGILRTIRGRLEEIRKTSKRQKPVPKDSDLDIPPFLQRKASP